MVRNKINPKAKTIEIKANSKKEFFLIHGYTGSVTDFNGFEKKLNKKFNANIKAIRLKGHGTKIEDLDNLEFEDFLNQVERELKKDLKAGKKIVLGGVSFGGFLALILAAKYSVKGVFVVGTPYKYKHMFPIYLFKLIGRFKKYWLKGMHPDETADKSKSFYYNYMPHKSLKIMRDAKKLLEILFYKIEAPCLLICSKGESLAHWKSSAKMAKRINSPIKEIVTMDCNVHNVFHSPQKKEAANKIIKFFEKNKVFEK